MFSGKFVCAATSPVERQGEFGHSLAFMVFELAGRVFSRKAMCEDGWEVMLKLSPQTWLGLGFLENIPWGNLKSSYFMQGFVAFYSNKLFVKNTNQLILGMSRSTQGWQKKADCDSRTRVLQKIAIFIGNTPLLPPFSLNFLLKVLHSHTALTLQLPFFILITKTRPIFIWKGNCWPSRFDSLCSIKT